MYLCKLFLLIPTGAGLKTLIRIDNKSCCLMMDHTTEYLLHLISDDPIPDAFHTMRRALCKFNAEESLTMALTQEPCPSARPPCSQWGRCPRGHPLLASPYCRSLPDAIFISGFAACVCPAPLWSAPPTSPFCKEQGCWFLPLTATTASLPLPQFHFLLSPCLLPDLLPLSSKPASDFCHHHRLLAMGREMWEEGQKGPKSPTVAPHPAGNPELSLGMTYTSIPFLLWP